MVPTADQVAHAIVAASKHFDVDPIEVFARTEGDRGYVIRSRALIYAMMAIADLWGNDAMASRVVGGFSPNRAANTRTTVAARKLRWWDPRLLEEVKAAIPDMPARPPVRRPAAEAPTLPAPRENAQAARNSKPAAPPARKGTPNFGTVAGMGPPRPPSRDPIGEKSALRNMLAEAVRNTAKLPSQK